MPKHQFNLEDKTIEFNPGHIPSRDEVLAALDELDRRVATPVPINTQGRLQLTQSRTGLNQPMPDFNSPAAFLILGGPSAQSLDLSVLNKPGFLTMAVNNAASLLRPDLWCSVDPPMRFLRSIWMDPRVMKFVPNVHRLKPVEAVEKDADAQPGIVSTCPNVLLYKRFAGTFDPSLILTGEQAYWGDQDPPVGEGGRSVMWVALRILIEAGVKRIYLVGCDFVMSEAKPYAFTESKTAEGVAHNNASYRVNAQRFEMLRPVLEEAGVEVFNCNPDSSLGAFEVVGFGEAVARESMQIDVDKEQTKGMYEHNEK